MPMTLVSGIAAAALVLLPLAPRNPNAPADRALGVWRLNVAKSRALSPLQEMTALRSFEPSVGGIHISEIRQLADGTAYRVDCEAAYDGRAYAVLVSDGETPIRRESDQTVTFSRADANSVTGVLRRNGTPIATFRRAVSNDGKTLEVVLAGTDASGAPTESHLVYDRVTT